MSCSLPLARSFPPIVGPRARLLILGSMPGAASLAAGEYYAHPRNAFWRLMGDLYGADPEAPYDWRCQKLAAAGVAVWDVLRECRRAGSLDANILAESEQANDFLGFLTRYVTIDRIYFNGHKAHAAFRRHALAALPAGVVERLTLTRLPSTSPAHAGRSYEEKLAAWKGALCAARF
ncbi:MAG: DNA-deoxyinosine glycosylase [Planctomycetales bacterium]|nr:DNA-deoxyinosine glycosylase [Planctomycetales bacterium]